MSREVNLGQIVPNIQVGATRTITPKESANVINVGTSLNPIFDFYIPKGDPGAISLLIVNELPLVGREDTLYFVPKEDTEESDMYDEYVWINNDWELVGTKQITVDLSDYYTKTETNTLLNDKVGFTNYATASVGGVAKTGYSVTLDSNGTIMGVTREYNTYSSMNNNNFITKGTLENVITGKGLINRTYADARYVLEETIDDEVGYMYISPNIKDDKDVDFSINAQSNLDLEAYANMNFGVEYDENEGKGHGYFRLGLYDAGSIEIDNKGTKITDVIAPTNDGDAVNKLYVDSLVGDIGTILDNINGEVIGG